MYFKTCTTQDEAKTLLKELAKIHHPVKGGTLALWEKINAEFSALDFTPAPAPEAQPAQPAPRPEPAPQAPTEPAQAEPQSTPEEDAAEMQQAIDFATALDGCIVELVGSWLWVTGNTLKHWNALKDAGFKYAVKKKCCYYRTKSNRVFKRTGKQLELEEIKNKYGVKQLFK